MWSLRPFLLDGMSVCATTAALERTNGVTVQGKNETLAGIDLDFYLQSRHIMYVLLTTPQFSCSLIFCNSSRDITAPHLRFIHISFFDVVESRIPVANSLFLDTMNVL